MEHVLACLSHKSNSTNSLLLFLTKKPQLFLDRGFGYMVCEFIKIQTIYLHNSLYIDTCQLKKMWGTAQAKINSQSIKISVYILRGGGVFCISTYSY